MKAAIAAGLAVLTGCSGPADDDNAAGAALERTAIARGIVRDPDTRSLAGLYGRDTDRVCVVAAGEGYRVGVSVDYGAEGCSARGRADDGGDHLRVRFDAAPGCAFDIAVDGDGLAFPAVVPAACERLCSDRASLAALEVDRLSDAASEAADLRDRRGRRLCGS